MTQSANNTLLRLSRYLPTAMRLILITAVLACVPCLAQGQGTFLLGNVGENIVTNGSFEDFTFSPDTTLPGWTWRTCLIYSDGSDGIPAANGLRFPIICGLIYQDIATLPGQHYQLRFAFGGDDQAQVNAEPLRVSWGGHQVAEVPVRPVPLGAPEWQYLQFEVLATSTLMRLGFSSLPRQAFPMIDDVSITAVPEPATLLLWVVAIALMWIGFRGCNTRVPRAGSLSSLVAASHARHESLAEND